MSWVSEVTTSCACPQFSIFAKPVAFGSTLAVHGAPPEDGTEMAGWFSCFWAFVYLRFFMKLALNARSLNLSPLRRLRLIWAGAKSLVFRLLPSGVSWAYTCAVPARQCGKQACDQWGSWCLSGSDSSKGRSGLDWESKVGNRPNDGDVQPALLFLAVRSCWFGDGSKSDWVSVHVMLPCADLGVPSTLPKIFWDFLYVLGSGCLRQRARAEPRWYR